MMQTELKTMKEFRRKRTELENQIVSLSQSLKDTHGDHKQQLIALEQKFFDEKVLHHKFYMYNVKFYTVISKFNVHIWIDFLLLQ